MCGASFKIQAISLFSPDLADDTWICLYRGRGQQMSRCLSLNTLAVLVHHLSITHSFLARAVHLTHQKGLSSKTANFTKMLASVFYSQKQC